MSIKQLNQSRADRNYILASIAIIILIALIMLYSLIASDQVDRRLGCNKPRNTTELTLATLDACYGGR